MLQIAFGIILALVIIAFLPALIAIGFYAALAIISIGVVIFIVVVISEQPELLEVMIIFSIPILGLIAIGKILSSTIYAVGKFGGLVNALSYFKVKYTPSFNDSQFFNKQEKLDYFDAIAKKLSDDKKQTSQNFLDNKLENLESYLKDFLSEFVEKSDVNIEKKQSSIMVSIGNYEICEAKVFSIPSTATYSKVFVKYFDGGKRNYENRNFSYPNDKFVFSDQVGAKRIRKLIIAHLNRQRNMKY